MKSINSLSDINVSRVLRLIWQNKGISRIELANQLGIDKSTVTKIVAGLQETGIVSEFAQGTTGPQGGRKPIYLEITSTYACIGGIEINPDRFVCCLLNLKGTVLFQYQEKLFTTDCKNSFFKAYEMLAAESKKLSMPLVGIGVGLPAIVNCDSGVILQSIPLGIKSPYAFSQEASNIIGIPVYAENDARCCCYGERILSYDIGFENSIFVLAELRRIHSDDSCKNLSVGIGIVIDGKIYKGADFSSGEFRSLLWQKGNQGQFHAGESNLEQLGLDENVIDSVLFELAQHIAFLVITFNLDMVYIGGIEEVYAQKLSKLIDERIIYQWPYDADKHSCKIRIASLKNLAVAYGAAGMFIDRFFALPSLSTPSGNGPSILESLNQLSVSGLAGKML